MGQAFVYWQELQLGPYAPINTSRLSLPECSLECELPGQPEDAAAAFERDLAAHVDAGLPGRRSRAEHAEWPRGLPEH